MSSTLSVNDFGMSSICEYSIGSAPLFSKLSMIFTFNNPESLSSNSRLRSTSRF